MLSLAVPQSCITPVLFPSQNLRLRQGPNSRGLLRQEFRQYLNLSHHRHLFPHLSHVFDHDLASGRGTLRRSGSRSHLQQSPTLSFSHSSPDNVSLSTKHFRPEFVRPCVVPVCHFPKQRPPHKYQFAFGFLGSGRCCPVSFELVHLPASLRALMPSILHFFCVRAPMPLFLHRLSRSFTLLLQHLHRTSLLFRCPRGGLSIQVCEQQAAALSVIFLRLLTYSALFPLLTSSKFALCVLLRFFLLAPFWTPLTIPDGVQHQMRDVCAVLNGCLSLVSGRLTVQKASATTRAPSIRWKELAAPREATAPPSAAPIHFMGLGPDPPKSGSSSLLARILDNLCNCQPGSCPKRPRLWPAAHELVLPPNQWLALVLSSRQEAKLEQSVPKLWLQAV